MIGGADAVIRMKIFRAVDPCDRTWPPKDRPVGLMVDSGGVRIDSISTMCYKLQVLLYTASRPGRGVQVRLDPTED